MFLCATYLAERTEPLLKVSALQSSMWTNQVTQGWITVRKPGPQEAMAGPSGPLRKEEGRGWPGRRGIPRAGCWVRWPGTCGGGRAQPTARGRGWGWREALRGSVSGGESVHPVGKAVLPGWGSRRLAPRLRKQWGALPQGLSNVVLPGAYEGVRAGRAAGTVSWEAVTIIRAERDKDCKVVESGCVEPYIYMEFQSPHSTVIYII